MTAVAAPRLPGHLPSTGDVGVNYSYMVHDRELVRSVAFFAGVC